MAYPTSPSQVGCTDKSAITTILTGSQTYSSTQTVTNTRFRGPVNVSGGTVTFRNCIFYLVSSSSTGVRTTFDGLAIVEDCEYGLGPDDSYPEDPDGWAGAVANVAFDMSGNLNRVYVHHANDLIRLKSGLTVSRVFGHKLVSVVNGHGDAAQMIGGSGVLIEDSYLDARHDPTITPASGWGVTGSILIKADTAPIDDVTITRCYLDSSGNYTLRVDDGGAQGQPTNVTVSDIRIGPNHTSAPILFEPNVASYDVCGIYLDANDALVSGVSSCPSNDGGNVSEFVAFGSATPSGTSLTLTLPSDALTGHLLLATVFDEGVQTIGGTTDNSAPAGWTLIGTNNSPSRTKDIAVWYKFVVGGETPGTTTYGFTGGSSACLATIAVYSGVDDAAPIAASVFSDDDTFNTNRVITGATTTEANQRVVVILGDMETSVATPPGDLTQRGSVDTARVIINTDKVQATAGATGTFTFTSGVSQRSNGAVIVLESAAGGANLEASASLAGTGTLTANAVVTRFASAALSGTGALTADAQRTAITSASLSGTGTLTASAQRTTFASVALAGVGTLLVGSQSAPVALVPTRPSVRPGRLAGLLNQGALVINRSQTGPPDEYGTPTWTESEFVTVCHVQPISTEEMAARPADRVRYRAWFPAGTAIGAPDRIVLASGLEAEVVGSALAWFNPRRRTESHLVVYLADVSDEATGGS